MSEDDRKEFEILMSQDSELQAMVKNYKHLENIADIALELQLLEEVKSVTNDKIDHKPNDLARNNRKLIYLVISALILSLILYLLFSYMNGIKQNNVDQYFAENYERPVDNDVDRSATNIDLLTDTEKAKYYFSLNDWKKSEEIWNEILTNNPDSETESLANYYLGHIYLNQYKFDKAEEFFEKSTNEEVPKYLNLINELKKIK